MFSVQKPVDIVGGTVVFILIPLAELELYGIQAANLQGFPVSAPSRDSRWAHFA
jgi:hypothetical protein